MSSALVPTLLKTPTRNIPFNYFFLIITILRVNSGQWLSLKVNSLVKVNLLDQVNFLVDSTRLVGPSNRRAPWFIETWTRDLARRVSLELSESFLVTKSGHFIRNHRVFPWTRWVLLHIVMRYFIHNSPSSSLISSSSSLYQLGHFALSSPSSSLDTSSSLIVKSIKTSNSLSHLQLSTSLLSNRKG